MRCAWLLAVRVIAGVTAATAGTAALGDGDLGRPALAVAMLELVIGLAVASGILARPAAVAGWLLCAGWGVVDGWDGLLELGHDWPLLPFWVPIVVFGPGDWTLAKVLRRRAEADLLEPVDLRRRVLLLQGGTVLGGALVLGAVGRSVPGGRSFLAGLWDGAATIPPAGGTVGLPGAAVPSTTVSTTAPAAETTTTAAPEPQPEPVAVDTGEPADAAPPPTTGAPTTEPPPDTTTSTTTPPLGSHGGDEGVIAASKDVTVDHAVAFVDHRAEPGILVRRSDGTIAAYAARCTHDGCIVEHAAREVVLRCPCCGSTFSPDDGTVITAPALIRLSRWQVVELDGQVVLA